MYTHPRWSSTAGSLGAANFRPSSPAETHTTTLRSVPSSFTSTDSSITCPRWCAEHAALAAIEITCGSGAAPVKRTSPWTVPVVVTTTAGADGSGRLGSWISGVPGWTGRCGVATCDGGDERPRTATYAASTHATNAKTAAMRNNGWRKGDI